jgi:hypothetical protein
MRRDRPTMPEQPGSACGLGSSGSLHLAATARYAFRLTKGRRRSSFSGASRPIWGMSARCAAAGKAAGRKLLHDVSRSSDS